MRVIDFTAHYCQRIPNKVPLAVLFFKFIECEGQLVLRHQVPSISQHLPAGAENAKQVELGSPFSHIEGLPSLTVDTGRYRAQLVA